MISGVAHNRSDIIIALRNDIVRRVNDLKELYLNNWDMVIEAGTLAIIIDVIDSSFSCDYNVPYVVLLMSNGVLACNTVIDIKNRWVSVDCDR